MGRPQAIPEAIAAMIVATDTAMVATHAITFTRSMLRPKVLDVIAAAACVHAYQRWLRSLQLLVQMACQID